MKQRIFHFSLGSLLTLIIVYFIYLFSKEKGWTILAFLSKAYLVVVIGFVLLVILVVIIILVLLFFLFKKPRKTIKDEFYEADYKVK